MTFDSETAREAQKQSIGTDGVPCPKCGKRWKRLPEHIDKCMHDSFPHLELIENNRVHDATQRILRRKVPEYFYEAPATSSDSYCREEGGLWLHTLMVATVYERLVDSYLESGFITEREADCGRAACLLHDIRKYGDHWEPGQSPETDHELRAAEIVRDTRLSDKVADVVSSHMSPESHLARLVHYSDMVASSRNIDVAVYDPPGELQEYFPELEAAEF